MCAKLTFNDNNSQFTNNIVTREEAINFLKRVGCEYPTNQISKLTDTQIRTQLSYWNEG
jgi:hypothetical protein